MACGWSFSARPPRPAQPGAFKFPGASGVGPGPRPGSPASACGWPPGGLPVGPGPGPGLKLAGPRPGSRSRPPSLPVRAFWPAGGVGAEGTRPWAGGGAAVRDADIRDMGIRDLTAPHGRPPRGQRLPGDWARGRTPSPSRNRMPRNAQRQWQWQWHWVRLE